MNAHDQLRMFVICVDAYEEMRQAFPIKDERTFRVGSTTPRDPQDHWHRIVRLTALRKFTMSKADDVYVEWVLQALQKSLTGPTLEEKLSEAVEQWLEKLARMGRNSTMNNRDSTSSRT
jgi:hypothetical protein